MKCFCTTPVPYFNKLLAHNDWEFLFVCYHYSSIRWVQLIWTVRDTFSFPWFYIYLKWSLQKCKIQVSWYPSSQLHNSTQIMFLTWLRFLLCVSNLKLLIPASPKRVMPFCMVAVLRHSNLFQVLPTFRQQYLHEVTQSFQSHYGPGIDSASNRNEYQEYFLGVQAAGT